MLLEVLLQQSADVLSSPLGTDLGRRHLLKGNELESSLLESGDDLTDESSRQSNPIL